VNGRLATGGVRKLVNVDDVKDIIDFFIKRIIITQEKH